DDGSLEMDVNHKGNMIDSDLLKITDGSKDVDSSNIATVDLTHGLVDITSAKQVCPFNDENNNAPTSVKLLKNIKIEKD
ncbi:hypothetical protein A2U01_0045725, partial [Trifolium medium]|nr:hypothetical protein [Trifolium medium]